MSWAISASCVLEGYECQSPGNSSELPGYLDTSLPPSKKHYLRTSVFFFRPLSTTLFRSRSTMGSRLLRADKKLSHRQGSSIRPCEPTRAKSRGGYLCGKVRISIYTRHASFHSHARQKTGEGRRGAGECNKVCMADVHQSRHLLVACARHCSHWQLPRSTIEG